MRVQLLKKNPKVYSSNSYLIRGDFNSLNDKNVLIDTGGDDFILKELEKINTGVGKKRIEKIILTHNHFDHTGGVKAVKKKYNCKVLAFSKSKFVDRILENGEIVKVGDEMFEVIHCPSHSNDSILLYGWDSKVLFCGDIDLAIINGNANFPNFFIEILQRLLKLGVSIIYPGHGDPLNNGSYVIGNTISIIKNK